MAIIRERARKARGEDPQLQVFRPKVQAMLVSQYNKILAPTNFSPLKIGICFIPDRGGLVFPACPGQPTREGTVKQIGGGLNVTTDLTGARSETRGRHRRLSGKVTVIPPSRGAPQRADASKAANLINEAVAPWPKK